MKFNYFAALILGCLLFAVSCNKNEETPAVPDIPANVVNAFNSLYPGAAEVAWTITGNHAVASFLWDGVRSTGVDRSHKAWFALSNAEWDMTSSRIAFSALPAVVKDAFAATVYAQSPWTTNDRACVLTRNSIETLYILNAYKTEAGVRTDADLHYTADGILVKESIDADSDSDYDDHLPQQPAGAVDEWLKANFPNARIVDIDQEHGRTEVCVVDEQRFYEIYFNSASAWICTKKDLKESDYSQIPAVVMDALKNSESFTSLTDIDDVEYYKTASAGNYYLFELESRTHDDLEIYISEQGQIIERPVWDKGEPGDIPVEDTIEKFIAEKYPQAVIVDRDSHNGYLRIRIRHEGIHKEILFNGSNAWVESSWEVALNKLPEAVKNLLSTKYGDYEIDDIEFTETPQGAWFEVELESKTSELKVFIDKDGNLIKEVED